MKIIKDKFNIKNERINTSDYYFKQPKPNFLQLPFRLGVIGSSNTGKTNCIVNYLDQGKYRDVFTTIVVVSPTASIDPITNIQVEKKFNILNPDDFYSNCDFQTFKEIIQTQQQRINKYSQYLDDLQLYKKFRKNPEDLTDHECLYLYDKYKFKKPTCEYNQYPTLLIILDDTGDEMKEKFLSKFVIKARHIFTSLIFISQYYAMIPSLIRNNLSSLILFKTMDHDVLQLLYQKGGFSSDMSKEDFYKMLDSLKSKHEFLFVDFNKPIEFKYRKNFNEIFANFDVK